MVGGAINVGMTLTGFLAGRLTDKYGEKRVLVTGSLLTGLSIMLASMSNTFLLFYSLLIFTGFWAGSITPAASKAITNWFFVSRLGFAQSVRQAGITIGGFLAALILPRIANAENWHMSLIYAGISGVLGAFLVQLFYSERPLSRNDVAKTANSLSLKEIMREKNIWLVCLMGMLFVGGQFCLLSYLELYLQFKAGLPIHLASIFLSLAILGGILGRIVWGGLSDSLFHGARQPVLTIIGGTAAILSLSMLAISKLTPFWVIAGIIFMLGFTAIGWNGVYVTLLSELPGDKNSSATVVGIGISFMQLGVLVIPPLFGFLVDIMHTYQASWLLLSLLMVLGVVLIRMVNE